MTARDARMCGAGYLVGCLVATVACLISIALETHRAKS